MKTAVRTECAIVGGGIAGLSALNALLDLGIKPMLFEGDSYPRHKVCGEFFSHEAAHILARWGIMFPISIGKARFFSGTRRVEFDLPEKAYGLSRYVIDKELVERARASGGVVEEGVSVKSMEQSDGLFNLLLSNGVTVQAQSVIFATGRHSVFAQNHWKPFEAGKTPYVGLKMHYSNLVPQDHVDVFMFPQAYVGVSSIEDGRTNVACLAKTDAVLKAGGAEKFLAALQTSVQGAAFKERLAGGIPCFERPMSCGVPPFGKRKTISYPHSYYVGDAFGAMAPVCGNGLGMAVTSGCLAAQYAALHDWKGYHKAWQRIYSWPLRWGGSIQKCLFNPLLSRSLLSLSGSFAHVPQFFFSRTRNFLG